METASSKILLLALKMSWRGRPIHESFWNPTDCRAVKHKRHNFSAKDEFSVETLASVPWLGRKCGLREPGDGPLLQLWHFSRDGEESADNMSRNSVVRIDIGVLDPRSLFIM